MAIRKVFSETKGMKVKEVLTYVKPMLSLGPLKNSAKRGIHNYSEKYIQTSSVQPLYHVCFAGMIFSFLVALPNERRHLEHQLLAKDHGSNGGGRSLITSRSFICNTGFLL
ncbi:PREDICTED: uncharacterized protein LOC104811777 [Tarenaya hassleriana]|uniref:uncharacterized protein LOC104811777 n=1 Tax=Tarenaya hassleriana TaxID=28532 RepID=UPI0008FCF719|nr:PREDICTED: uncharacterized protein LOC104811777 [Tarenaya hassleriana]XP_019058056.1 PREDICTED: uncharacterized protein LOC104811777 [Tarenaya hassleriana]XP_019058057.1 PREDICTED: uncharacterized protein LOC104811777 [Tarenaya hassleriana]